MKVKEITDKVDFELNDDELLPLTKCVCGEEFGAWDFTLSMYSDRPSECPNCRRKLYFDLNIKVYEIKEK